MEYLSAIKRSKVLINAVAWMQFRGIMLSRRSQSQKETYCVLLII